MLKKIRIVLLASLAILATAAGATAALTAEQELGKLLYFDRYLSSNHNQSCASCHDISAGFADPLNLRLPDLFPVSAGSITTAFGGRNAPASAYALYSPPFGLDPATGLYFGGQFWDGRAPTLKDQAKGPFLNPVEMNMGTMANVIAALTDPANRNAPEYQRLFASVYQINLARIPLSSQKKVADAYDKAAQAIGEYEKSALFAQFSSKYDAVMAGAESFTASEANGLTLFNGKAQCNLCHPAPLFTDFTYDNLGIPKSTHLLLAANPVDTGLGGVLGDPLQDGKFKVSSLRNIDLTPPYGHNGYFATLKDIIHFYNTARDTTAWPPPEVAANVNRNELGNLMLTEAEELDLVAFLKTLTDRFEGTSYPPVLP